MLRIWLGAAAFHFKLVETSSLEEPGGSMRCIYGLPAVFSSLKRVLITKGDAPQLPYLYDLDTWPQLNNHSKDISPKCSHLKILKRGSEAEHF